MEAIFWTGNSHQRALWKTFDRFKKRVYIIQPEYNLWERQLHVSLKKLPCMWTKKSTSVCVCVFYAILIQPIKIKTWRRLKKCKAFENNCPINMITNRKKRGSLHYFFHIQKYHFLWRAIKIALTPSINFNYFQKIPIFPSIISLGSVVIQSSLTI